MSTVKISQLPENSPTTNTSNTLIVGVNMETDVTGVYTLGQIFEVSDAYAQAAFLKANTPSVTANSAAAFANASFVAANSGATFANASFVTANAAYDSQNTTSAFANASFVTANASFNSQNTTASFANGAFTRANSGYGVANTGASFANGAFVMANSSYDKANSGATFANGAFTRANSAYNTANSALQNTSSIIVNTDLTVPGTLTVTGALYSSNNIITPTSFVGSQTAISLSFSNSSLVRANIAADLVVTPGSFIQGKIVDLVITNTSGQQRGITHGCSAINSTIGASSFNLGSTRTAVLRYFSFNGDLANTYVSVTYQ